MIIIKTKTCDYLRNNGICDLEDLVGKAVFITFPSKGIMEFTIRKIEYTIKTREWFFVTNCSYRLSRLGEDIFFTKEEARVWQLERLKEYTEEQQEKIIRKERELREKEIKELNRLLQKYPDEESRKLPVRDCLTCKNNFEFPPPHTCDICTSLD